MLHWSSLARACCLPTLLRLFGFPARAPRWRPESRRSSPRRLLPRPGAPRPQSSCSATGQQGVRCGVSGADEAVATGMERLAVRAGEGAARAEAGLITAVDDGDLGVGQAHGAIAPRPSSPMISSTPTSELAASPAVDTPPPRPPGRGGAVLRVGSPRDAGC